MYKEEIYNVLTGETTFRDYTPEEIAAIEERKAELEAEVQAIADAEAARLATETQKAAEEATRLSAKLAIYAKLGLTEEEINTLIS